MPFETLDTVSRDTHVPRASISYERSKGSRGPSRNTQPRLIIAIPTTLSGLCKRERFRIEVGTGKDAGKARISGLVKGVPGSSAPGTMLKHTLVIRFGYVPAFGDDAAAKEHVPVRKIDDNTWEIDLPPWFKVDQPQKSKAA